MNRGTKSLLVIALVLAAAPAAAQGSFPGENGKIAYSSGPCGSECGRLDAENRYISTIGPKGRGRDTRECSKLGEIPSPEGPVQGCRDYGPAWSADGSRLAFSNVDGLVVTGPDGAFPRVLVPGADVFAQPAFSPDGDTVAYTGGGDVRSVPFAGGASSVLAAGADSPAFSATGRLAFSRGGEIWVANADGSDARALRPGGSPDWAPGGRRIIFECGRGICRMTPQGRKVQHVRGTRPGASDPVYSPDGRLIAFSDPRGKAGPYEIRVVKSIGGRRSRRLARGIYPSWRPLVGDGAATNVAR